MRWFFLTCLFVLAGMPALADTGWVSITDPTKTFSVAMPKAPTFSSEERGVKYTVDMGSAGYVVMDHDFSDKSLASTSEVLDSAVKGASSEFTSVISDKNVTVDGHEGRDVTGLDKNGIEVEDQIFFFNNHLYQFITARAQTGPVADTSRFTASARFLR